jgi:hypothetical protein
MASLIEKTKPLIEKLQARKPKWLWWVGLGLLLVTAFIYLNRNGIINFADQYMVNRYVAYGVFLLTLLAFGMAVLAYFQPIWKWVRKIISPCGRWIQSAATKLKISRKRWWLAPVSVFLVIVSILIFLNSAMVFLPNWKIQSLANVHTEIGYAYLADTGHPELTSQRHASVGQVLEDGKPLAGPANAYHKDIRQIGLGRYSFWGDEVYFSTSDNTNPLTNGRTYEFYFPIMVSDVVKSCVYVLTVLSLLALYIYRTKTKSKAFQAKVLFFVSCIIVVIAFLITRLPWFVDYPLPIIQYDTSTYFYPVKQLFSVEWPDFTCRTPGYPLFLAAIYFISPSMLSVVILQNLLTLASVLFLLWVVYKTYGRLVIGAAVAMVAHVTQPLLSGHDFVLITESLFTSVLLFSLGFLCLAIKTKRSVHYFIFSILGGYAILVRPAGAFLFGTLLLTLLYLVANRSSIKDILCAAIPMPLMIILLMTYNYATAGVFSVSSVGDLTLYGITATYWEPDATFPEAVNEGIENFHKTIPEADQEILNTSWNPYQVYLVIMNANGGSINNNQYSVFHAAPELTYNEQLVLASQVSKKAMKSHPDMAVKVLWANLYLFMIDNASWNIVPYTDMEWVAKQMYIEGTASDQFISREYHKFPAMTNVHLDGVGDDRHFVIMQTPLSRIDVDVTASLGEIFDNKLWLSASLIALLCSLFITIKSGFRHQGAFLLLAVSTMELGAGMVIALTTALSNRYPSPTRFVEVLTVALIPLLLMAGNQGSTHIMGVSQTERRSR